MNIKIKIIKLEFQNILKFINKKYSFKMKTMKLNVNAHKS